MGPRPLHVTGASQFLRPALQPIPRFFKRWIKPSMYIVTNLGLKTPPCLVPETTLKCLLYASRQKQRVCIFRYQEIIILRKHIVTFLSISSISHWSFMIMAPATLLTRHSWFRNINHSWRNYSLATQGLSSKFSSEDTPCIKYGLTLQKHVHVVSFSHVF